MLLDKRKSIWGWTRVRGREQTLPYGIVGHGKHRKTYRVQVRRFPAQKEQVDAEITFTLVSEERYRRIKAGEVELSKLFLEDGPEQELAQVLYLVEQSLWNEALSWLERDASQSWGNAAIELLKGRLALGLALRDRAGVYLAKARDTARGDLETRAEAVLGLASLELKSEDRREILKTALELFVKLGDEERESEVREKLKTLP